MLLPRKRRCTKCGEFKPCTTEYWHKDKTKKWGFHTRCKICRCEKCKEYRDTHKEWERNYNKARYQNNREEILKGKKQYYLNNQEEIKKKRKQYYDDNREEILEKAKEYHKENPHVSFNNNVRRREKEENQGNGISKDQWFEMMNFFEWKCAYSGIEFSWHNEEDDRTIDHIVPLNNNGEHEVWNCVPCYARYNYSKQSKDLLEWYQQQEFYSEERLDKIYQWQEYAKNKWMK